MKRKNIIRIVLSLLIVHLLLIPAYSFDGHVIEYFYEINCKKCEKARPVIENVASVHNLSIMYYNINDRSSIERMNEYGIFFVVPAVVVGDRVIYYSDYDGNLSALEDLLNQSIHDMLISQNRTQIGNQTDRTGQMPQQPPIRLSIMTVFIAGLVAGFNPCLLAILAFIASVTLSNGGREGGGSRRMLWMVLVFCAGIFITYLVAGIGLLQAIGQTEGTREVIEKILITIIALLGIWHIYDAYHIKRYKTSSFRTSGSAMSFIEKLVQKESIPAIFLLGVLFSLVKAPCVGALYLTILNMLIKDQAAHGALYLGVYNLGVIFPVLALGLAITFGMQPESVSRYRDAHRGSIRFVTGVLLMVIAVLMSLGVV